MKLLVDENLSPNLARSLALLFQGDHVVQHIQDKFGKGLADEDWIPRLGAEGGWCVLSGDRRIASTRLQRDLFIRNRLVGFFPAPAVAKLPMTGLMVRVLLLWPAMVLTDQGVQAGCYELPISTRQVRIMR